MNPDERTAAVYIPERLSSLEKSGRLELLEGYTEFLPGLKAVKTGGHTRGHQAIEASSGDTTVVYYADIVPSSHHLKVPYVASVDLFPLDTMKVKRELLGRLVKNSMAIAFDHDIDVAIGRISQEDNRIVVNRIE
jgi:glyoxylase-like metal-dependent hydrolase (beta-lactamase superfamily II)